MSSKLTPNNVSELSEYDVAVVGAGIAGLTSALHLANEGLSVLLLDAAHAGQSLSTESCRQGLADFPPRVSAITPANARYLNDLDIWSQIPEMCRRGYQKMSVWEQLGGGNIQFDAAEYQCTELGFIVENEALEYAVAQCLKDLDNVAWETHAKVVACDYSSESQMTHVSTEKEKYIAKLVVAADGANSSIRHLMGFKTTEWDYEQKAIVCTVQTELPHESTARQRFSERGPVALLPLSDSCTEGSATKDHFSSLVWSLDTETFDSVMGLSDEAFCIALEQEMEGSVGRIVGISKRFAFPLRQRQAKQYVKDNVVLVADAAHTIHPLAGQGLNLGLSDVATLCSLVGKYHRRSSPVNHPAILARYQRERKVENLAMASAMEVFKRLFGSKDPIVRLLRNAGVNLVNQHTLIKRKIATQAMGLN